VARAFFDLGEFNISLVECPVRSASQPCGRNAKRGSYPLTALPGGSIPWRTTMRSARSLVFISAKSVLPPNAPGLTTNAVIIFLLSRNDLLLPIIMTGSVEQMTLPVLISSIVTPKFFSYTLTHAAGLLATLPTLLLALLLQRYVVRGLTAGAVKG
jgi:hypothetical protein